MQVDASIERVGDLLEDFAEEIDYSIVGARDTRLHETRTTEYPYNTICHLGRDFGDNRWRGCTGVLVTPYLVLTAGHCVYNHALRRFPVRIRVIAGRADRDTMPYGSIVSSLSFAAAPYVLHRDPDFDYGVVVLPQPFEQIARFMPVQSLNQPAIRAIKKNGLITIAGYPGDRPVGTLWRHTERLKRITTRRLFYTVDTCPGHSGSPIWHTSPRTRRRLIIGIHTSGVLDEQGRPYGCRPDTVLAPPGLMNAGVRVTDALLAAIGSLPGGGNDSRMIRSP